MRAWWLLALIGCDVPFDLKQVPPPDGPPACFSTKTFDQNCHMVAAPDIEDTYLAMGSPDMILGRHDALLVTSTDPALIKFDVSMIGDGERIVDAQLQLTVTSEANNCPKTSGVSCGLCVIKVTQWQVSWMTSAWEAALATYNTPDGSTAWSAPGAAGIPGDRSPTVAGMVQGTEPVQGTPWILEATGGQLAADAQATPECWISNGTLGVQVTATDAVAISSRFHVAPPGGCEGQASPVLNLVVCQ